MNGTPYTCEGCNHNGAVDARKTSYECPVCRWTGPLPERERAAAWITWNSMFGKAPYPPPTENFWEKKARSYNERQCAARQAMAGDAKTQWKRRYQFYRWMRRLVNEQHA